jgi:hypothetical protein
VRYPSWITQDWDPFIYHWQDPKAEKSNDDGDEDESKDKSKCRSDNGDDDDEKDGEDKEAQKLQPTCFQQAGSEMSSFLYREESLGALQHHHDLYLYIL